MAKTNTAPFAQTPKTAAVVVTAAAASITTDSPTGTVQLMQAGAEGCIVTRLSAVPRATVTASSLLLFLAKQVDNYATQRLIDSELMAAQTVNATSAVAETPFANYSESRPLRLEAGDRLYVASQVALASGIVFKAESTDF